MAAAEAMEKCIDIHNHDDATSQLSFPSLSLLEKSVAQAQHARHDFPTVPSLLYHLHTLFLFTKSDIKTMLIPASTFGLILLGSSPRHPTTFSTVLPRALATVSYVWLHLLLFCTSNQRHAKSTAEDAVNKPWRPLPSGRITREATEHLLVAIHILSFALACYLRSVVPSVTLMVLVYLHNDLGYGSTSFVARNLLNGLGYMAFNLGAATVACQSITQDMLTWTALLGIVVLASIHVQDFEDQAGDALNDRSTLPLIIGDGPCRVSVAVAVVCSSIACPAYFVLSWWGYVVPVGMATFVCSYLWTERGTEGKGSFRCYMLWLLTLYFLPLMQA